MMHGWHAQVLHVGTGQLPVTLVLQRILQRGFPEVRTRPALREPLVMRALNVSQAPAMHICAHQLACM